jgi:hypothetical protein
MKPNTTIPAKQPSNPRLCACGGEIVPPRRKHCSRKCKGRAGNAKRKLDRETQRKLSEDDNKKQREAAAQVALQTVHDCNECRKVLRQLFLVKPAAIETAIEKYHKHVEAALALADPTISVQTENPCQCCHLRPVVGKYNARFCIECKTVRGEQSKRKGTRRYRARQRGEAPAEEVRLCMGCKEELEPDSETGRVDLHKQYCDNCAKKRTLKLKNDQKKAKSAAGRQQARYFCSGLKIDDEWIRPCGLWFVPEKTLQQEFCSNECMVRTHGILDRVDPEVRMYQRDNATKTRKLAKIALELGPKLADAEAAVAAAQAKVEADQAKLAEAKAEVERLRPKDPGRPSGPEEETRGQMRLIAAFLKCEWRLSE